MILSVERLEDPNHLGFAGEVTGVDEHVGRVQHVRCTQAVPRVDDGVVADSNDSSSGPQFIDTGQSPALRVAVTAALEHDVVERVGHDLNARLGHSRAGFLCEVVGPGVHRRAVSCDHAPTHAA